MNKFKALLAALTLCVASAASAQKCELSVSVAPISDGDAVPEAINNKMVERLKTAMSRAGITGSDYESQFFLAGKFDNAYFDVIGADSYAVKTTLTVYIGDADNQKVFDSMSFDLKGVGNSEQRAYIAALKSINGNNPELIAFIERAKDKIVSYFDANYKSYLTKANTAMNQRNYGEALYYATAVPTCCKGYAEAQALAMKIYGQQTDYNSQQLLAQARAAWAANPTQEGASEAAALLAQIDPASSSYSAAKSLTAEMQKSVKADIDFETKEKYRNQVALEKQRINAAKEVAVAWAKSRPRTVNRYVFVNRHYHRYY